MQQAHAAKVVLMLVVAVLALAACDVASQTRSIPPNKGAAASETPSVPPNKGAAGTITLDNTAPSNIDLALTVSIIQPLAPSRMRFELLPAYYYQQAQIISFTRGEKLQCNGMTLPMDTSSSYISTTLPASGTVIKCTYVSPQGQASFSFTVPELVKLISPMPGATVARSEHTPLTFGPTPACKALGVVLGYKAPQQAVFRGSTQEAPNGCAAQQSINTLTLPAGPGSVGVVEVVKNDTATNNTSFHSLSLMVTTKIEVPVTWQ